jgi:transposase
MRFFEALAPCLVGMEACATSHHWARELTKLGHEVRLMPAKEQQAMTAAAGAASPLGKEKAAN